MGLIKVIVAKDNKWELKDIPNNLNCFYKELDVDLIDIVTRNVNGVEIDIICDDEGFFKENPHLSIYCKEYKQYIVGNVIIASHDDEGNTASLSENQVANVLCRLQNTMQYGKVLICD